VYGWWYDMILNMNALHVWMRYEITIIRNCECVLIVESGCGSQVKWIWWKWLVNLVTIKEALGARP
jgi:hypothetical protein